MPVASAETLTPSTAYVDAEYRDAAQVGGGRGRGWVSVHCGVRQTVAVAAGPVLAPVGVQGIANARPLQPLPRPITDQAQITCIDIRRRQRLGGILNEYHHAA
ncbi:hypothetical protein JOF56_009560 [Kibdelosporangium banguiense]|uniref:Uncharacterized protein n=1 Tax=Kibdelosporangium banguiense TaxID=1365924 RepID=A0ABS4TXQ5_9PSEU|nr:hypothetical protein [Kibdelosporangium banguiense]MBP2329175.1 hypothetical protein [Kibdelosporangium banguiense]